MDNQLIFSRLNLLCDERNVTLETLSHKIGKSYNGFLKAKTNGTFSANDLVPMANALDMELPELVNYLAAPIDTGANEPVPRYVSRKSLSSVTDPLDFLRLLMSKSEALDNVLENAASTK